MNMRKLSLCLIALLCVSAACAQTAAQLFAKAKAEPDPNAQIKLLNKVIAKAPKMADAYHYRGDAYRSLGRTKQAVDDYSRTIGLRPKDPFRYYARALVYMDMNRNASAVADLTKAISLKPSYRNFYLARARANAALNKYDAAIADYKKHLGKRKPNAKLALEIAPVYVGSYRYSDAERLLNSAAKAGQDGADLHYWRGRVLSGQSRLDEAISAYSKALHRDNAYAPAYRYRAGAFKDMEDYPAALEDFTKLIALQPEAAYYNRRGLVYEEMGNFKKAAADYSQAIELSPKWAIPYNNRGFAKMHLKDWPGAKHDLETAIKLDGKTPTPYINLAGVYWLWKKDRKNAYQNVDKALRLNFKNIESLFDEDQKGWMFKGLNRTAEFRALLYK